jgi:hypothetical protein
LGWVGLGVPFRVEATTGVPHATPIEAD